MSLNDIQISTINFEVYDDGQRQLGLANVTLPELNFLTSETKGAGVAGTIEFPILGHFESMELKLTWRTLFVSPMQLMKQFARQLSLRGAIQKYDSAKGELGVLPIRIDIRCHPKGLNLGKFEPGTQTESENTLVCDYIKITEGDKNVSLEFDLLNYVYTVDGMDMMTAVRSALGV